MGASMTDQSLFQLEAEEEGVSYLLEALEHICLEVSVGDDWGELGLVEAKHSLGAILIERQFALGRHATHQGSNVRLQSVGNLCRGRGRERNTERMEE